MKKARGFLLVGAFLLTIFWWSSARADTIMEVGPSQVGSEFSSGFMITITERLQDRYDFTIGYISRQEFKRCDRPDCKWEVKEQIFAGVDLLIPSPWTDRLRLSIGPYLFQRADRIGTDTFRMGLGIEYRISERFGIRARHFSLAGSGPEITICRERINWKNVSCDTVGAVSQTNDWNTGQDSWLRATWYFN